MRNIFLLILLVLLTGCNKSSSGFDWGTQPHIGAIPQPIGRWATLPTYQVDFSKIYGYENFEAPPEVMVGVQNVFPPIISEFLSMSEDIAYRPSVSANPNIIIRAYYAPYVTRTSSSVNELDMVLFDKPCTHLGKEVSGYSDYAWDTPPNRDANYNGLALARVGSNREIKNVRVWINVYAYTFFKEQEAIYKKRGIEYDSDVLFKKYCNTVIKHELAHAFWGLTDDTTGREAGIMVYSMMTKEPNSKEVSVIKWLQHGK